MLLDQWSTSLYRVLVSDRNTVLFFVMFPVQLFICKDLVEFFPHCFQIVLSTSDAIPVAPVSTGVIKHFTPTFQEFLEFNVYIWIYFQPPRVSHFCTTLLAN